MARLIWQKDGIEEPDERVHRFLCGEDLELDRDLLHYDLRASRAHVRGLARLGMLAETESRALCDALRRLEKELDDGALAIDERFEDGHSAIEYYLVERLGEVGKKVHLGRSRNDQVLAAQRLYLRDRMGQVEDACASLATAFLDRAAAEADTPMPGYTHLQRAVPSSAGLWLASYAESFIDDARLARAVSKWLDSSPLGSAAGYGVNLPLDRDGVARELGHARVQVNPLQAQASRGKVELAALSALDQALLDVRRFAWDLSLFCSAEFGFVRLPDRFTTGSSIMPQKRNPDVVELLRAAPARVHGAIAELHSVLSLPSGYHRDLQATKGPVVRAIAAGLEALAVAGMVARALELDRGRMRAAISSEMFATDRAVELAAEGVPFRDAYRQAAAELGQFGNRAPEESLRARVSPGATAHLMLDALRERLAALD